jgi:hypothetical protein
MKSRVLEPLRFAGIAVWVSFWLACGANGPAAGGEAPAKPAPAETAGDAKKKAAPDPGSKAAGAEAGKSVQEASQGLGSFGKMLPLGQKNRDVKIPSFRDGNPSSFIRAATMTRLDDEKMEMERLDIRMFGETEDKDLRIMMPTATYQMVTEVLSSEDRSRVSRKDFDLQGDTLIFDTRSQQGKMTGHIHMVIHDADAFRQQPDKAAASGEKTTAPTTTPEKPKPSREKK